MTARYLGIDLGGTHIKACAVDESGRIQWEQVTETRDDGSGGWKHGVADLVADCTASLGTAPTGIGLCAPGLASTDERCIAHMPGRMQGLEGLDWSELLGRPVAVLNDAHAFTLGEAWVGAAKGRDHVVVLTLGTGVGGGVICDGRLLLGHRSRAGHLGHLSLDPEGPPDCTGIPGGLEDYIGELTLPTRSQGRFTTTLELLQAAESGDSEAEAIWRTSVRALAAGVASFINLFDPEIVVVGGGVAAAGDRLFTPLQQRLRDIEWRIGDPVPVVPAALGSHAGAVGAARHSQLTQETST